ncbi:hypothetical protein L6164_034811 [Bauhinia variegata]|uniref:Uncharacterized protein n=1 Tax=Bauhinia variegata TaxID=167791 RepID=A0ACB9KXC2_BAUVA|nr:hypothetical protein L6164_034811 [Bauhinia variegata]
MEYSGVNYDHMMTSLSDCGSPYGSEEEMVIKKGPWTEEEDSLLFNYITAHGEGHWNSVARFAGLKRTGKSCRLRWLNYLRPNVRRGNITLQEQLLILDLHCRWGNRWSKIAQYLPGRTDNEIKNYWRTRVVKQAKQLKCDVNSKQFRDALRFVWMPRLIERIQASSQSDSNTNPTFFASPHVQASSISDSAISYNSYDLISGGGSGSCSSTSAENGYGSGLSSGSNQHVESDIQPLEQVGNGFGEADLWTDENIWFLQQQLADH